MSRKTDSQDTGLKTVYLGLGGNVGDVLANMAQALCYLDHHNSISISTVSDVYKTPPWGLTDQDWFLNSCAQIQTSLSPYELLDLCLQTEKKLKRERTVKWGPRSLDIDILSFEEVSLSSETLNIPHPRMFERAFVMVPLSEIAASLELNGKSAKDWMLGLDSDQIEKMNLSSEWWREAKA